MQAEDEDDDDDDDDDLKEISLIHPVSQATLCWCEPVPVITTIYNGSQGRPVWKDEMVCWC